VSFFGDPELTMAKNKTSKKDHASSLSRSPLVGGDNKNTPAEPQISPEEGVSLIRAFVRIKQPALRAAVVSFVSQLGDL
jgi:hypothetical protein